MTKEKAIEMIDEYLSEPNNIRPEWIECLLFCRQALLENERLKKIENIVKEMINGGGKISDE